MDTLQASPTAHLMARASKLGSPPANQTRSGPAPKWQFQTNKITRTMSRADSGRYHNRNPNQKKSRSTRKSKSLGEMLEQNELRCLEKYIDLMANNMSHAQWLSDKLRKHSSCKNSQPQASTPRTHSCRQSQTREVKPKHKPNPTMHPETTGAKPLSQLQKRRQQWKRTRSLKQRSRVSPNQTHRRPYPSGQDAQVDTDAWTESQSTVKHSHLLDRTDSRALTENLLTFDFGSKLSSCLPGEFNYSRNQHILELVRSNRVRRLGQFESVQIGKRMRTDG